MQRFISKYNTINTTSKQQDNSDEIWKKLEVFLDQLAETHEISAQQIPVIVYSYQQIVVGQQASSDIYVHLFYKRLENQFITSRLMKFWRDLNTTTQHDEEEQFAYFLQCLEKLYSSFQVYSHIVGIVQVQFGDRELENQFMTSVYSRLFSTHLIQNQISQKSLIQAINIMLTNAFNSYCIVLSHQHGDELEEHIVDHQNILQTFTETCQKLNKLGMSSVSFGSSNICTQECFRFIYDLIKKKIEEEYAAEYEKQALEELLPWLDEVILPFLGMFFDNKTLLQQLKPKVQLFIYTCLAKMRINELFDIIKQYPESSPTLLDLKECLVQTSLHSELITSLNKAISKRLLIPGVVTKTIIAVYINVIKSVSIIDPTGVSLRYVSEDIKHYLREKRSDTIKCLVRELIDKEGQSELYKELEMSNKDKSLDYDSDDNEEWTPSPKYADPSSKSKGSTAHPDIIKNFVNMFRGNKDIFINEYRGLLSDHLLTKQNYDTNQEAHILELLKIRFGEKSLQSCDIMIKDISDSKFMSKNFSENSARATAPVLTNHPSIFLEESLPDSVSPILISKSAWPPLLDVDLPTPDVEIKLHPVIISIVEQYGSHYKSLKAPRRLVWNNSIGNISFAVEIGSKSVDIETNPINASILMFFCDTNTWTVSQLSKLLNLDVQETEKRVMYWVLRGFLKKSHTDEEAFDLVDEIDDRQMLDNPIEDHEEEGADTDPLAIYEPIIMNMLQSMEVMALDRIHNMLSLFVHDPFPAYDKTMQELGVYLGSLVQEGKIELDAGLYRVKY